MMTHHLYIRHGKRVSGDIDSPITESSNSQIQARSRELVRLYGEPDYIITSPYLRCRQTAELFNKTFSNTKPIYVDARVSSKSMALKRIYTSTHDVNHVGTLTADTLHYQPPLNEARDSVYQRVLNHRRAVEKVPDKIWIFTHRGFIRDLLELYQQEPRYLKCLGTLVIAPNNDGSSHMEVIE